MRYLKLGESVVQFVFGGLCFAIAFLHSLAQSHCFVLENMYYSFRSVSRGGVKAAEHAEFLLRNMHPLSSGHDSIKKGITDVIPNTYSVNAAITAW